jgi:D-hydroxyproline dehydrogenase subunit beta
MGVLCDRALRSRDIWLEVAPKADFCLDRCGSLHLAYRQDEMYVLQEFTDSVREWTCDRVFVCSGADFETLYPSVYAAANITKASCK